MALAIRGKGSAYRLEGMIGSAVSKQMFVPVGNEAAY
jgi:hypothetical protein